MRDRRCQKCGMLKPLKEFRRCRMIESGHLWKCKKCEMDDKVAFARSLKLVDCNEQEVLLHEVR